MYAFWTAAGESASPSTSVAARFAETIEQVRLARDGF